jgi:hypothetical protein
MTLDEFESGAGDLYLFHYTDAAAADLIIDSLFFSTGAIGRCGHGVYATDIPPRDADTIDDVITNCFNGRATPAEVDHVIVVNREGGGYEFTPCPDPYEWVLPTDASLEPVFLDAFYVAAARFDGSSWEIIDS